MQNTDSNISTIKAHWYFVAWFLPHTEYKYIELDLTCIIPDLNSCAKREDKQL